VAGAPLLLRLAVASSPGREHPGHQATITVDDRRHRHTHIDLKYPIHVDDYVAKERRPGRSQTTAPQPGEQLTEAGAQPGEFQHSHPFPYSHVRLLGPGYYLGLCWHLLTSRQDTLALAGYVQVGWDRLVNSIIQFVSQVIPSSDENACSHRAECGVMSDQMKRTVMSAPL
jgi:hypothetical protein